VSKQGASGGGESRPHSGNEEDTTLVLHEEEASFDKRWEGVGYAQVRREVSVEKVREQHPRQVEELVQERVPLDENDSGKIETLADGSISIPLFAEELVITRRTVLRERVIVRKETLTEWQKVETELRSEHVAFDTRDVPEGSVEEIDPLDAG
jgi:uncharacterized protein (TIGR02271 family)